MYIGSTATYFWACCKEVFLNRYTMSFFSQFLKQPEEGICLIRYSAWGYILHIYAKWSFRFLRTFYRPPLEAQEDELIAGLLWSDPILKDGYQPSTRGIGVFFGPDVTKNFLGT